MTRLKSGTGASLPAEATLRRRQLWLAQAIRGTILPQRLWLASGDSRLGIAAAGRRILGVSLRVPGSRDIDLRVTGLPGTELPRVTGVLYDSIRKFLDQKEEITLGFELLDEEFSLGDGLPAGVVLPPRRKTQPAQEPPAAPVTERTDVPAPDAPPLDMPSAQPAPEGDTAETADAAHPPRSMKETLEMLQRSLGPNLLLIWLPNSRKETAEALVVRDQDISLRSFPPAELGFVLRERP